MNANRQRSTETPRQDAHRSLFDTQNDALFLNWSAPDCEKRARPIRTGCRPAAYPFEFRGYGRESFSGSWLHNIYSLDRSFLLLLETCETK